MTKNSPRLSPADAAQILSDRRKARSELIPFAQATFGAYKPARHHYEIAKALEAVEAGEITRLMVLCPPRHGKTELCTRFCSWYLGRNPGDELIAASYNSRLGGVLGRKVRNVLDSPQYQRIFPEVALASDSKARDLWHTQENGTFLATGIRGGSTGFGANGLYIDDPIKGREEADSETIREDVRERYGAEFYSRLMPRPDGRPAWIVLTYTPWHEQDLGQELLEQMRAGIGDEWHVVRLPAIAEDGDPIGRRVGEALWPERYPIERLERVKGVLDGFNPRDWPALYQCAPAPEEGTFFQRDWFTPYRELPRGVRYVVTSDFAVSESEKADYTVHAVWAVDQQSDAYLVDLYRARAGSEETIDAALDFVAQYRAAAWVNEKGVIWRALGPLIQRRMREREIACPLPTYARTADKSVVAESYRGRVAAGRIRFPADSVWWADFLREHLAFPAGQHDDCVDAGALFGQHLAQAIAPPRRANLNVIDNFEASVFR